MLAVPLAAAVDEVREMYGRQNTRRPVHALVLQVKQLNVRDHRLANALIEALRRDNNLQL